MSYSLIPFLLQVNGIGPTFKLTVNLQNTSLNNASTNLHITFDFDDKLYNFRKTYIPVCSCAKQNLALKIGCNLKFCVIKINDWLWEKTCKSSFSLLKMES